MKEFFRFVLFYWIITNPLGMMVIAIFVIAGMLSHWYITIAVLIIWAILKSWLFNDN